MTHPPAASRVPDQLEPADDLFAAPQISVSKGSDSLVISSQVPLGEHPPTILHSFHQGCNDHPQRILVAERRGDGWEQCTWAEARERVSRIAQGLVDIEAAGRPIMILSHNSITHLLLTLAAYSVGSPAVPVSVAYSLQSKNHAKVRAMAEIVDPAVVFAENDRYLPALQALDPGPMLLTGDSGRTGLVELEDLESAPLLIDNTLESVTADDIAKILFTSGSTGAPKGVINTHRMLAANQQQIRQVWPFLRDQPPVLLDWLPWSHTFGGNHNVNLVLANGGTLWIDDGRPTPDAIHRTIENLGTVHPTVYFNVPSGYAALLPILEREAAQARLFFSQLRIAFFAAAPMPQDLWDRLQRLARIHGSTMRMTTSWGMTETAPAVTTTHFPVSRSDSIGVPLPGVELKLMATGSTKQILVRGPNVTPGFFDRPDLNADLFDCEGYLRTGDAGDLADQADPTQGLVFAGRIAEDFKLSTGTFVHVGSVRAALLEVCTGLIDDAVICGSGADFVAALVWLKADLVDRRNPAGVPDDDMRRELAARLTTMARAGGGSSQRVERLIILTVPPSLDSGELTDKGSINQLKVRSNRADIVAELLAEAPSPRTVCRTESSAG
ncbi:AMP-binding protein [Mycolicibacterium sp. CBM1]